LFISVYNCLFILNLYIFNFIVFDSKCATEYDYDYISINDIEGNALYNRKIHGRIHDSNKHFPGVNGVPPVIINSSECVINMTSDYGNLDWGFQVTVYGIISEPKTDELKNNSLKSFYSLGCWILNVLLSENNHETDQYLFQCSILNTMRLVLERNKDSNITIRIVDLLALFFIKFPHIASSIQLENNLILEIYLLRDFLINDIKQYEDGVAENITLILKSKIQLLIIIEELLLNDTQSKIIASSNIQEKYQLQSKINKWKSTSNISLSNDNFTITRNSLFDDNSNYITNITEKPYHVGEVNSISIKINNFSTDISIGVCKIPFNLINEKELNSNHLENITWSCKGFMICDTIINNIDPKFVINDVITIKIDLYKQFIEFYRNSVIINGMSIGPTGSGKYIEMDLGTCSLYPFVNLYNINDEATIICDTSTTSNSTNTINKNNIFVNTIPDFMKPIQESVTLLKSILYRKLPDSIVVKKFLPDCVVKSKQIIESNDWNGEDIINSDVIINGAQSMTIVFDDISLSINDVLNVYDANDSLIYTTRGFKSSSSSSNTIIESLVKHIDISNVDNNINDTCGVMSNKDISIGDRVVRGMLVNNLSYVIKFMFNY
jgi:hypothetical protein